MDSMDTGFPWLLELTLSMCDGHVTDVASLRHDKVSFTTRGIRTLDFRFAKRDHYQLRQRKASFSLTRVAYYIPEG